MKNRCSWIAGLLLLILGFTLLASAVEAQSKIVFSQGPNGNELWVREMRRSVPPRHVLTMGSYIITPRWSRDGKKIAFQSGTQLWVVNEDGADLHSVPGVSVADAGLDWDPSGDGFIYATVCVCCEHLRAVNKDGTNDRLFYQPGSGVLQKPDTRPGDLLPSPLAAFHHSQCGQENFPNSFFGTEMSREAGVGFTQIPGLSDVNRQQFARWSKDGAMLLTTVRVNTTFEWALEILDPFNSSAPRERMLQGPDNFSAVDFGCSTQTVFFVRETDGSRNIWMKEADLPPQQITEFQAGLIRDLDHFCKR